MRKLTKSLALGMAVTSMLPIASVQAYEVNDVQRKVTVNPYDMAAITGSNRYETAAKLAQGRDKSTVILVNADKSLADGLSASGLAGAVNAPILLVKANKIPAETKAALKGAKNAYIIGGKNAISSSVENQIKSMGIKPKRIEGSDRIKTSIEVSYEIAEVTGKDTAVYLVNGFKGEADAMSIAPVAAKNKGQIILTNGKYMPINVSTDIPTYAVGGSSVMSNAIVSNAQATRIGGKDRYETNRKVIEKFFRNEKVYYMAKGNPLVDALTTSAMGKPVALVSERSDKRFIGKADKVISIGGVSNRILTQVRDTLEASHTVGEDGKPVKPEDTQKPDGQKPEEKPDAKPEEKPDKPITPEKPVEPKPEKPSKPVTPEHKHNWIHHDAIMGKKPKYKTEYHIVCRGCGKDFGIDDSTGHGINGGPNIQKWENHVLNSSCLGSGYWQEPIKTLIGYEEYVSVPAWDECSGCGQIRK
ncbi:cell wall-binding repeat-containing protein [Peptacetobacter sp. AB845]|uniref:cell wall-binding repeat-containing protein n=1 Tax=Peptacetobacter sp. AB845 TaxID=3388429 RepID=UPI0039C9AF72